MKKTVLTLVVALVAAIPALSQGIIFEETTFQQALDKAKSTDKLIFVDCYTAWCGPCKQLASKVFTRDDVGAIFNAHFINIQVDMEKGEGPELATRYNVKVYPTLLVLEPDGAERHRVVGYRQPEALIQSAREALGDNSLAALRAAHDNGNRQHALIVNYTRALIDANNTEEAERVADEHFNQLTDEQKTDPDLWPLYTNATLSPWGTPRFAYLCQHRQQFDRLVGKQTVDSLMHEITTDLFTTLLKGKNGYTLASLPAFIDALRDIPFERQPHVIAEARFTLALTAQDAPATIALYREHGQNFSTKGITNLIPLMRQKKQQLEDGTHPASLQLVQLIETIEQENK
ncbi:MAG: thioredoxin family protein [Odoribacteraceae bacterium]|jgi:thiol-disulfide isomerase/thioredoxin|nr:thioredoxin family protein [Odoribacteraceae bacterium]